MVKMKSRIIAASIGFVLSMSAIGFATPAMAETNWTSRDQQRSWITMKEIASEGSERFGRRATLKNIKTVCRGLDNSYSPEDILAQYSRIALKSATSERQFEQMEDYSYALVAVATYSLCSSHREDFQRAVDRYKTKGYWN